MHLPVYMCLFSSHILIFMVTLAGIFSTGFEKAWRTNVSDGVPRCKAE